MLLELPVFSLTVQAKFSENKKKFHKIYAVRVSFTNPYYRVEETNDILDEWINHHKLAFNSIWLQPELCPSSRRVHYHGFVDVKDQFKLNHMLRLFKPVGSFHLETIKSTPREYLNYCTKEVGITECCNYLYNQFLSCIKSRRDPEQSEGAPMQDNTQ